MANNEIKNIWERDLVFFDTELTGLEFHHEIVELGFLKVSGKTMEVMAEKSIKIKPEHLERADPEGLQYAGYDQEVWEKEAVDLKTALTDFLTYTQDVVLVGHNLPMDWMHLRKSLAHVGLKDNFYYKGLDTFSFAWARLRGKEGFEKFSLGELAEYFEIPRPVAHRALEDARITYEVFKKLIAP